MGLFDYMGAGSTGDPNAPNWATGSNPFGQSAISPATQGLLALSSGLLQAGGASRLPVTTGAAIGQGAMLGLNQYNQAQGQQLTRALLGTQVQQALWRQQMLQGILGNGQGPNPALGQGTQGAGVTDMPNQLPALMQNGGALMPQGTPGFNPMAQMPQQGGMGSLDPTAARVAALNEIVPGYSATWGQLHAPTDFQKIAAAARAGDTDAQAQLQKLQNIPPVSGRPGGYLQDQRTGNLTYLPNLPPGSAPINPNNPAAGVQPIPGAAPIAASQAGQIAGAQAGARAEHELAPGIVDAQGRPVPTSVAAALGGQPTAPMGNPNAANPNVAKVLAPDDATARRWAKEFSDKGIPIDIQVKGKGVGPSIAERTSQEAGAKATQEEAGKLREAANLAVDTNYNLQNVLKASDQLPTGKFTDWKMGVKSALQGILPDSMTSQKELNDITNYQEFKKYSIKLGFDQARKMGARESTQIVEMSIGSNPNPEMVKPAIQALSHGLIAQNDYVIAKAKAQDAWAAQHNGDLQGFNSDWQSKADPRAFAVQYMTPVEMQKSFSMMSVKDKQKILDSLTQLRAAGIF